MIINASALIAIPRDEPEAAACAAAIEATPISRLSAANFLETAIVIDASRDPVASRRFDDLLREARIVIEPVTEGQSTVHQRNGGADVLAEITQRERRVADRMWVIGSRLYGLAGQRDRLSPVPIGVIGPTGNVDLYADA